MEALIVLLLFLTLTIAMVLFLPRSPSRIRRVTFKVRSKEELDKEIREALAGDWQRVGEDFDKVLGHLPRDKKSMPLVQEDDAK